MSLLGGLYLYSVQPHLEFDRCFLFKQKREEYHLHVLIIVGEVILNGFLYFFNEKSTHQKLFKLFVFFFLTHLVNKA